MRALGRWRRWGVVVWVVAAACNMALAAAPLSGTLTVFAAASLTESFTAIGEQFQRRHPGLQVRFNFAGSQTLRTQLEQGAPADVFAVADTEQMALAKQRGAVHDEAPVFIANRLVILTPNDNPEKVASLRDLARPGVKLVLAGQHVPAGRYSRNVLRRAAAAYGGEFEARALRNLVSEEHNVKQVVTKIQLGEADAGIAYVSDLTPQSADAMRAIAIPEAYNLVARYPIAIVNSTRQQAAAQAFIDFVRSPQGQAIMKTYNFTPVTE